MMRALVLERRGRHAIVLLPGGEVRRVSAKGAAAGDEILLPQASAPFVPVRRYAYGAGALALALAVLPALLPMAQAKVAAYVTVDINPSVELGLSPAGTVLTSRPLDSDGRAVLAATKLRGESLNAALGDLLRTAVTHGFLPAGTPAAVIVAGYGAGSGNLPIAFQGQLRSARSAVAVFLQKHGIRGVVSAMIVPQVLVQAARRAHVSAGVYAVWSALHRAGSSVAVNQMRGRHLAAAMAKVAGTPPGKAVLPLLTGKAATHAKSGAAAGRGHGDSHGLGRSLSGPPGGPAKGGAHASVHGKGSGVQVQVVTPGGTVQLPVGGDNQEGGDGTAPATTPLVLSPGEGHGHGHGKGKSGQGEGRGSQGQGLGSGTGLVGPGTSATSPGAGSGKPGKGLGRGHGQGNGDRAGAGGDGRTGAATGAKDSGSGSQGGDSGSQGSQGDGGGD